MMDYKKIVLLVAIVLCACQLAAQQTNMSLRPAINVEKTFSDKFSLQLEHEVRYHTSLKEFERFTTSLGADYALSNKWNAGLTYHWLYNHTIEEDFYASRNRFDLYLKYEEAIGDWDFTISEKFRTTYYNESKESPSYSPKNVLFTKAEAAYNIKSISLSPYINGQLRYMVNHPAKNEINQYRWSVGAKYKISKLMGVNLFFEQRGALNVENPTKVRIIGTVLEFTI